MGISVHQGFLGLCETSPKEENDTLLEFGNPFNDPVSKFFPTFVVVGSGLIGPDGQDRIEKKYTLVGPFFQVAMRRRGNPKVILQLLEDIHQRRGLGYTMGNRKAKSVGLTFSMIWVLSEKDNFDLFKRCMLKCIEDQLSRRINCVMFPLIYQELFQLSEIGRLEFLPQDLFPALLYVRIDGLHGNES